MSPPWRAADRAIESVEHFFDLPFHGHYVVNAVIDLAVACWRITAWITNEAPEEGAYGKNSHRGDCRWVIACGFGTEFCRRMCCGPKADKLWCGSLLTWRRRPLSPSGFNILYTLIILLTAGIKTISLACEFISISLCHRTPIVASTARQKQC